MFSLDFDISDVFKINSSSEFNDISLKIFRFQVENNSVYKHYLQLLNVNPSTITNVHDIPFLPIDFFKTHQVVCGDEHEKIFLSSGTTQQARSKHYVKDSSLYEQSFTKGFELFYGNPSDYCILALLPNYLEQGDSSLVYMMQHLIAQSNDTQSGFFLNEFGKISDIIQQKNKEGKKCFLIGVTYALLDFAEQCKTPLHNTIVMETGGMKGRRKELIREELHAVLKDKLGVIAIHSEYGMTELLSQAYSKGDGKFTTPPWMKVLTRSIYDPFSYTQEKSGALNIIDLANVYSCSFIATQDIGKLNDDGTFEILGRVDNADVRGCNLMVV
jgi:phenylacetate-coenzyme A ligase PaaK-like adenylate-forming protein